MKMLAVPSFASGRHDRRRSVRFVAAAVLVSATGLAATACGTSGSQGRAPSAADFVRRITTEFSRGQSGRLWDELVPADQRVVSRARFVACQANEGWNLKKLDVLETYKDPVNVGAKTLQADAVTVRVTSDDGVTTATMHAVPANGTWRWVLQPADRQAYLGGKCPRTG